MGELSFVTLLFMLVMLISLQNKHLIVEIDIYFDEWNIMRGKYYCAQKSIRVWLYDTTTFSERIQIFDLDHGLRLYLI